MNADFNCGRILKNRPRFGEVMGIVIMVLLIVPYLVIRHQHWLALVVHLTDTMCFDGWWSNVSTVVLNYPA